MSIVNYMRKKKERKKTINSRTPWYCGLIHNVLDRKVEGSNLAAAKNLFKFKSTKISLPKSEQNKREHSHSSPQSVHEQLEKKRKREEKEVEASFEASF